MLHNHLVGYVNFHQIYNRVVTTIVSSRQSLPEHSLTSISSVVGVGRDTFNHGGLLNSQHELVEGQPALSHSGSLGYRVPLLEGGPGFPESQK